MELRLSAKKIVEDNLAISWDFNEHKPTVANLRELVMSGKIKTHLSLEIKKFFNL